MWPAGRQFVFTELSHATDSSLQVTRQAQIDALVRTLRPWIQSSVEVNPTSPIILQREKVNNC
jgi:hypothetical protein